MCNCRPCSKTFSLVVQELVAYCECKLDDLVRHAVTATESTKPPGPSPADEKQADGKSEKQGLAVPDSKKASMGDLICSAYLTLFCPSLASGPCCDHARACIAFLASHGLGVAPTDKFSYKVWERSIKSAHNASHFSEDRAASLKAVVDYARQHGVPVVVASSEGACLSLVL